MTLRDIRIDPNAEKERVYEQVHALYRQGKSVKVKEHKSGFPAVRVDCENIHILTDIISLEKWWAKKKEWEEWQAKKKAQ
uniref:Uncharacterized protein n=1 Tax=viral metagenome TaxID=1070528 RepID=A0A6H1Z673_9ZZZZ